MWPALLLLHLRIPVPSHECHHVVPCACAGCAPVVRCAVNGGSAATVLGGADLVSDPHSCVFRYFAAKDPTSGGRLLR